MPRWKNKLGMCIYNSAKREVQLCSVKGALPGGRIANMMIIAWRVMFFFVDFPGYSRIISGFPPHAQEIFWVLQGIIPGDKIDDF